MRSFLLLLVSLASCLVACTAVTIYTPAALADQITNLPGLPTQPTFNQFAGYLLVNETTGKSIFYWYTESTNQPETDPLLWWSNGGPGCSGLLGFLTEHGPFRTAPNGGLEYFPFAWNTLANTLYVEAPAGVGFSYSNDPSDYTTGDAQTAQDNFVAIQQFLIRFPHLTANPLYISAESYGGHYVPMLAQVLVDNNQPNFKGFLLGNPLTDPDENSNWGQAGTLCGHSLASRPTCDTFTQHCLGASGPDSECDAAQQQVVNEAGGLDAYGLDYPTCNASREQKILLHHVYKKKMQSKHFSSKLKKQLQTVPTPYDPCEENEETVYLNRADVKAAIHVSPKAFAWAGCTNNINYNMADGETAMEPIYQFLLANTQLQMVIFSGDDDSVCASLGTQHWMFNLVGTEITSPWTQWMYTSEEYGQQIGGSIVQFKGISLVTVHGAGHMVSGYQPERGLAVLSNYLKGAFSTTAMSHASHSTPKKACGPPECNTDPSGGGDPSGPIGAKAKVGSKTHGKKHAPKKH
jgi:carboxypeptidase C (cathepsin A)